MAHLWAFVSLSVKSLVNRFCFWCHLVLGHCPKPSASSELRVAEKMILSQKMTVCSRMMPAFELAIG